MDIQFKLPNDVVANIKATKVRRTQDGFLVRFTADPSWTPSGKEVTFERVMKAFRNEDGSVDTQTEGERIAKYARSFLSKVLSGVFV